MAATRRERESFRLSGVFVRKGAKLAGSSPGLSDDLDRITATFDYRDGRDRPGQTRP